MKNKQDSEKAMLDKIKAEIEWLEKRIQTLQARVRSSITTEDSATRLEEVIKGQTFLMKLVENNDT